MILLSFIVLVPQTEEKVLLYGLVVLPLNVEKQVSLSSFK